MRGISKQRVERQGKDVKTICIEKKQVKLVDLLRSSSESFGSTGTKIQKEIPGVDLMHFGSIERILGPKRF